MGGLRGRLQCCLIDTQSQRYCQGPSQSQEKQSTLCTYCEQTNTPVQMHKMTGRNTQEDKQAQVYREKKLCSVLWHGIDLIESKTSEGSVCLSVSCCRNEELKLTDSFNA